jgi:hypothetical protein
VISWAALIDTGFSAIRSSNALRFLAAIGCLLYGYLGIGDETISVISGFDCSYASLKAPAGAEQSEPESSSRATKYSRRPFTIKPFPGREHECLALRLRETL